MRTIIIADNQDITRAGIFYLCEKMTGSYPLLEVTNKKDLLDALVKHPDAVVILDYTLFDLTGIDDLLILQARFKEISWLLFSESLTEDFVRRVVFSDEVFSIVMKEAVLDEIRTALQAVIHSQQFICTRIKTWLQESKKEAKEKEQALLTSTETEILKLIALGKTTKEIATERFSSIHTITTHRKNIFRKLQVNNVHEATKYALRAGILDSTEYYI